MGIYDEKLGEYKVALSVDYQKFNEELNKANESMTNVAMSMSDTAEKLTAIISQSFVHMTESMGANMSAMQSELEKFKASVKGFQTEISKTVGDTFSGSSGGSSSGVGKALSEYAKRTQAKIQAATEMAEMGTISEATAKAFGEHDTNIKMTETSLNAVRKAQTELNKLAEQYNEIMRKVQITIDSNGKLSNATLTNYKQKISEITNQYQVLLQQFEGKFTKDFIPTQFRENLFKNGAYDLNARNADREKENAKRLADLDKLKDKYRDVYKTVQEMIISTAKMTERQFNKMNRDIDKLIMEMRRLGDRSAVNPLAEQFGRKYGNYLDMKGFNDNLDGSIKRTNMLVDGFKSLKHHIMWMVSATALATTVGIPASVIASYKDTERQMAGMIQVLPQLHHNQAELNNVATQFIGIAQRYGMSVHEIIEAGKLWGRGWKQVDDIMKLTTLSAKLAVADMMDVGLANRAVESVINSYQQQANAVEFATHVVDSWTKIAHNAQSSATDLADALMRAGAAAQAVGVDFDTTNALASTMIKVTGRTGAEVGRLKLAA